MSGKFQDRLEVSNAAVGPGARATSAPERSPKTHEGGAHVSSVRADILGGSRPGESPEAQHYRRQGDDPPRPLGPTAGIGTVGYHHERAGATAQASAQRENREDREQRVDGLERPAQDRGRVGDSQADAMHDSTAAGTKDIGDVSRLRRLRAARGHGSSLRLADLPHRVTGRRGGTTVRRDASAGMGGCGSHRTTALRTAIRLGRARHRAEGWATTLCATHARFDWRRPFERIGT